MNLPREAIGSLEKQLDPIASQGGSVTVFLRKHIATCDFPGGGGGLDPLSPLWIRPCINSTMDTLEFPNS